MVELVDDNLKTVVNSVLWVMSVSLIAVLWHCLIIIYLNQLLVHQWQDGKKVR